MTDTTPDFILGWLACQEAAWRIADGLHYPDETKISASIRDAIRSLTPPGDLRAALAAMVKPLVWHNFDVWTWWAESVSGTYHVDERNGGWRVRLCVGGLVHDVLTIEDTTPANLELARAAAEADNIRRVVAAIMGDEG